MGSHSTVFDCRTDCRQLTVNQEHKTRQYTSLTFHLPCVFIYPLPQHIADDFYIFHGTAVPCSIFKMAKLVGFGIVSRLRQSASVLSDGTRLVE